MKKKKPVYIKSLKNIFESNDIIKLKFEYKHKSKYNSHVLKTSYKQKNMLLKRHLEVICDSYYDYINGEASGCSYKFEKLNTLENIDLDCSNCCICQEFGENLRGKFNPKLDKIIK